MDKKTIETIKALCIMVGIGVAAAILLNYTTDIFKSPRIIERVVEASDSRKSTIIETHVNESVPDENGTGGLSEPQTLDLIKSAYTPSANVFSNWNTYQKESVDLALYGEFESANLYIEGDITDDSLHFLTVNVGTISGSYWGERIGKNKLRYDEQGVFTKDQDIRLSIDLLSTTKLSATEEELERGFSSYKSPILWTTIVPPPKEGTKVSILIAPYDQNGIYGRGAKITKLQFQYVCRDGENTCKAAVCDKSKHRPGSKCIEEYFGKDAAASYSKSFTSPR